MKKIVLLCVGLLLVGGCGKAQTTEDIPTEPKIGKLTLFTSDGNAIFQTRGDVEMRGNSVMEFINHQTGLKVYVYGHWKFEEEYYTKIKNAKTPSNK